MGVAFATPINYQFSPLRLLICFRTASRRFPLAFCWQYPKLIDKAIANTVITITTVFHANPDATRIVHAISAM